MSSTVQAVAFPRDAWRARDAVAWLKRNGFSTSTREHTRNFWRYGQRAGDDFDTFATKTIESSDGRPVQLVVGFRTESNPSTSPLQLSASDSRRLRAGTEAIRRYYRIPVRRSLGFGNDVERIAQGWGSQQEIGGELAPVVRPIGPAVRGLWTIDAPLWAHEEIAKAARSRGGRPVAAKLRRRPADPAPIEDEPDQLRIFNPSGNADDPLGELRRLRSLKIGSPSTSEHLGFSARHGATFSQLEAVRHLYREQLDDGAMIVDFFWAPVAPRTKRALIKRGLVEVRETTPRWEGDDVRTYVGLTPAGYLLAKGSPDRDSTFPFGVLPGFETVAAEDAERKAERKRRKADALITVEGDGQTRLGGRVVPLKRKKSRERHRERSGQLRIFNPSLREIKAEGRRQGWRLTDDQARDIQRQLNPAGYPGSSPPRQITLPGFDESSPPVALFRPRLDDGSRPRLYVKPGAGYAELMQAKESAEAGEGKTPAQTARWRQGPPEGLYGRRTIIYTAAAGGGCLVETPAQYVLTEIEQITPSHRGDDFTRRSEYPAGVQERQYHRDKAEQLKIIEQARCFAPELVANSNPDAVNGPPIVGQLPWVFRTVIVLGGNSRTMTLERVYSDFPEAAQAYREWLEIQAPTFGFEAGEVAWFDRPILVRLVELDPDMTDQALRELVRRYNESLTQGMDPAAFMVAVSNRIGPAILRALAAIPDGDTFNSYLRSGRSRDLIRALQAEGVIDRRTSSAYISKRGLLNEDGRQFVARALVGRLVPDPVVLAEIPVGVRESLAQAVPFVFKAAELGPVDEDPSWDLTGQFGPAAALWINMRNAGEDSLRRYLEQSDIEEVIGTLERDPSEAVRLLVWIFLNRSGSRQLSQGFRQFADQAERNASGAGGDLFGHAPGALETLRAAFGAPVESEP